LDTTLKIGSFHKNPVYWKLWSRQFFSPQYYEKARKTNCYFRKI